MLQGRHQEHQSSSLVVEFPNLVVIQRHCSKTCRSECLPVGVDAVLVNGSQRLGEPDLWCAWVAKGADVEDASQTNFSFCFFQTQLKITSLFIPSWPKMLGTKNAPIVVELRRCPVSSIGRLWVSVSNWFVSCHFSVFCVECRHTRKRALQAHEYQAPSGPAPPARDPLGSSSPHSARPSGCSRQTATLCQAAISVQTNVHICPSLTVSTRSPAGRRRCLEIKQLGISFEHSRSFTVYLSVKANLSARNRQGDVLQHAGSLHLDSCFFEMLHNDLYLQAAIQTCEQPNHRNRKVRELLERGGLRGVLRLVHEHAVQCGDVVVVSETVRVVGWSAYRAMRNCVTKKT